MKESELQSLVNEYLRKVGISDNIWKHPPTKGMFYHIQKGQGTNQTQRKGIPDILIWTKQGHFAIELKSDGKKATKEQDEWLTDFSQVGGGNSITSSDFNEVIDFINEWCL